MITELTRPVREIAIEIRKKQTLKIPDAVIAATSIHLDFPLITMDTDFGKVSNLNAVVIDVKA